MDISAVGASAQTLVNKQIQQAPSIEDITQKADLFSSAMAAPEVQAAQKVSAEDGNLITKVVDSLRDMQVDFRNVMSGLMSDGTRDAAFGGSSTSVAVGDTAKAAFELRPGTTSGPNVSGLPADLGDNAKMMYSMTRELIGSQIDVTKVVVSEQMFSTAAGKVQKSTDMLLRGS